MKNSLLVCTLLLLLVGTPSRAAPRLGRRVAPSAAAIKEASQLFSRAHNVRHVRVPLRASAARRGVFRAVEILRTVGVRIDQRVPIMQSSGEEHALLNHVSKLLRGAPSGSAAYAMRRKAVLRTRELRRRGPMLPREMKAFANGANGKAELTINLDTPFYGKPAQSVPIIAHEARHLRDIKRALAIESRLAQGNGEKPATKRKLERKLAWLWSRPDAETRAFQQQAHVLGRLALPIGVWWRAASQNPELDKAYPPARINSALVRGYFAGIGKRIAVQLGQVRPETRHTVRRYLAGYKKALRLQAKTFYRAREPGVMERYKAERKALIDRINAIVGNGASIDAQHVGVLGQYDALLSHPPRVDELLASKR